MGANIQVIWGGVKNKFCKSEVRPLDLWGRLCHVILVANW
jgi:hypothetical protein